MTTKLKYMIVEEYNKDDMDRLVNHFIEFGWKPQGGIAVVSSVGPRYIQAMIKDEEEKAVL